MIKTGIGIGCMWYGIGNTGLPNPAAAFVEVHSDCSATLLTGCADIGQGSNTVLAQIVAETLGIDFEDVFVTSADTGVTPEAGATSASRQTYISGNACKRAAEMARQTLVDLAADLLQDDKDKILLKDKMAFVKDTDKSISMAKLLEECDRRGILVIGSGSFNPDTTYLDAQTMAGIPYATYAFATHIAEVEVNTETGEIKVKKIIAAHDVGKAVNPSLIEGQIEGGCLMGAGYALLEEVLLSNGRITNPNLSNYLLFTAKDVPEVYPIIVEEKEETGPYGAKGVGEPSLIPTAPAILNAIYNATGERFTDIPVTQERFIEQTYYKFDK
ncbi:MULTISPECIES: xanthine dehydrogenase family protein molybdopterin-binding subunit [Tepidanaerobacter]|uniref:xanthine dehydrogenase family protein molybdopterin-binding subunit n=1 Tax=Tepidanaerobacter TaxID=499228 RepID=UPI00020C006E|nr:Xanthine dehydrogenase [Tepidanaerobacter acetatoxydans Re1]